PVEQTAERAWTHRAEPAHPRDHRNGSRDGRLEPQLPFREPGGLMKSLPLLRDELLVRGDEMLLPLERAQVELLRGIRPADDLDNDGDLGVVEDRVRIRRDRNVAGIPHLLRIAHRRRDEAQRTPGGRIDPARAIGERARDRRAYGAQPEEADANAASAHLRAGRGARRDGVTDARPMGPKQGSKAE